VQKETECKDCCQQEVEKERKRISSWILSQIDGKDPKIALQLILVAEAIKQGRLS
jgi:hypothetical protein